MVTLNVETDLDITDGVRGEIVDEHSTDFSQKEAGVELVYKANALEGLDQGVLSLKPMSDIGSLSPKDNKL